MKIEQASIITHIQTTKNLDTLKNQGNKVEQTQKESYNKNLKSNISYENEKTIYTKTERTKEDVIYSKPVAKKNITNVNNNSKQENVVNTKEKQVENQLKNEYLNIDKKVDSTNQKLYKNIDQKSKNDEILNNIDNKTASKLNYQFNQLTVNDEVALKIVNNKMSNAIQETRDEQFNKANQDVEQNNYIKTQIKAYSIQMEQQGSIVNVKA